MTSLPVPSFLVMRLERLFFTKKGRLVPATHQELTLLPLNTVDFKFFSLPFFGPMSVTV